VAIKSNSRESKGCPPISPLNNSFIRLIWLPACPDSLHSWCKSQNSGGLKQQIGATLVTVRIIHSSENESNSPKFFELVLISFLVFFNPRERFHELEKQVRRQPSMADRQVGLTAAIHSFDKKTWSFVSLFSLSLLLSFVLSFCLSSSFFSYRGGGTFVKPSFSQSSPRQSWLDRVET